MTLRVEVSFPEGEPNDKLQSAKSLAVFAANGLTHVSTAQIQAFNKINRLHPFGAGEVLTVTSTIRDAAVAP
ncbi:MAG: hypothetical protein H7Y60_14295 [Rhodospirillaceae bacterium]|nr:hypothetical protein [Rhodospirillales bacterium]